VRLCFGVCSLRLKVVLFCSVYRICIGTSLIVFGRKNDILYVCCLGIDIAVMFACRTDIYMYVIDGLSKKVINDVTYHKLNQDFVLVERQKHHVVGITVEFLCLLKM